MKIFPYIIRRFAVAVAVLMFAGTQAHALEPLILPTDEAQLVAVGKDGTEHCFTIEIAIDPADQAAGLMHRMSMKDDHGMLFVFPSTRRLSFWMKNTPMPLDLVFIGEDGVVVDVLEGKPFSTDSIGPVEPARFVLEVKKGIAEKSDIAAGTVMRHPAIDEISGRQ